MLKLPPGKSGNWLRDATSHTYLSYVSQAYQILVEILISRYRRLVWHMIRKPAYVARAAGAICFDGVDTLTLRPSSRPVSARWPSPLYNVSINNPIAERPLMRHAFPNHISHANPCLTFRFVTTLAEVGSSELLLDEERPQMGQLPCTCSSEDHQLDHHPSNDTGVCGFGLVSEFGLSLLLSLSVFWVRSLVA